MGPTRALTPAAWPRRGRVHSALHGRGSAATALALAAGAALAATALLGVWVGQEAPPLWTAAARGSGRPQPRPLLGGGRRDCVGSGRQRPGATYAPGSRTGGATRAGAAAAVTVDVEALNSQGPSAADFVLPVGPSCPFRSSVMELRSIDQELALVVSDATKWSGEFAQLASAFMSGVSPDKAKARTVGTEISRQGQKLRAVLDELEGSKDFQAMEAYHTLEVMARRTNAPSLRSVEQLVNWQGDGLLAFADGRPLGPLPPGVDPQSMAGAAPGPAGASPTNRVVMDSGMPRVLPFTEADFDAVDSQESRLLKVEFQRLCKEHKQLIGLGETYGDFDSAGKEFYLGQMAQTAFRWEELIDEAQMAGIKVNSAFRAMSEDYLQRASLSADDFRKLVDDVHEIFRKQAEKEKGIGA
uniref:Uncharacterized protein n=1 Tax=Alexandrium monilatum TaxID=311494 RepID=A0A7S4PZU3_9DINO